MVARFVERQISLMFPLQSFPSFDCRRGDRGHPEGWGVAFQEPIVKLGFLENFALKPSRVFHEDVIRFVLEEADGV